MKRIFTLLLSLYSFSVMGQNQISSITISLPVNPAANTSAWSNALPALKISAQTKLEKERISAIVMESRMLITIKRGNVTVCGTYTAQTAPRSNFTSATKTWTSTEVLALLGKECTLTAGTYELCVQFYGSNKEIGNILLGEACKTFTISDKKPEGNNNPNNKTPVDNKVVTKDQVNQPIPVTEKYNPPKNITPANGKVFTKEEAIQPITISWSPVILLTNEGILYRVRVIEIRPGQTKAQALTENQPIKVIEVRNSSQASFQLGQKNRNLTWDVEAIGTERDQDGKFRNYGRSEATDFGGPDSSDRKFVTNEEANKPISPGDKNNPPKDKTPIDDKGVKKDETNQPGKTTIKYEPPKNELPANGKNLSPTETKNPIVFKWLGVTPPPPNNDVIYTPRIYLVEKGQSLELAVSRNKPVFEKQVSTTQTTWQMPAEYANSKELKTFVWNVSAKNKASVSFGSSEPTSFTTGSPCSPDYLLVFDKVECGTDGKVHVTGHITIIPKPTVTVTQIQLTAIKETNYTGANISTSISLPMTLTASGNNYSFSFIVNDDMCNKQLYLAYNITSFCSITGITSVTQCADFTTMPCCTCTYCDKYDKWTFSPELVTATTSAPFTVSLSTTITNPNLPIISFKAELVKFVHNGQEECMGCNKEDQSFGNFVGGTFGAWGNGVFPLYAGYATHHTLSWFGLPGSTTALSSPINLTFTAPPFNPLKCCDDEIQFCIRYSFTDKECRTCSFVKCYTIKRKH